MLEIDYPNDHYFYIKEQFKNFPGRSILDIGCKLTRNMLYPIYHENGYTDITALEIFESHCIDLRKHLPFLKVVNSDVRKAEFPDKSFDTIVWWHGPEHVTFEEFEKVLVKFERWSKKYIILGTPWGHNPQPAVGGNEAEIHTTHWELSDHERFGFTPVGLKRTKAVFAYKNMSQISSGVTATEAEKPSVGIVTTWFERGAAHVSRAFREALKSQYQVHIYARGGEKQANGEKDWDKPYVTWQPVRQGEVGTGVKLTLFDDWVRTNNIKAVIYNEQRDREILLHCQDNHPDLKIMAYIDYYTTDEGNVPVESFGIYDKLICCTRRHFSVFKKAYPDKAVLVPWGTDTKLFQPVSKPEHLQHKVVFFHNAGMWGVNGRKGTEILLEAWQQFVQLPDWHLIIHSQVEPPLKLARWINTIMNVELIQKEIPHPGLYHMADFYVYPTKLEGIGLSICEALACGLPVITTDEAPMNEFVRDGYNGALIPTDVLDRREDNYYWCESPVKAEQLVSTMLSLTDDRSRRNQYKINARKSAEQEFNWDINGKYLLKEIDRILL